MDRKIFLILLFLSFIVFNLNFRTIGATDSIPASLLPFNILSGRGVYFDDYYNFLKNYYSSTIFLQVSHGHFISSYPIMSGLLSIPIYIPFYILIKINALDSVANFYNYSSLIEKLSASLIASVSVSLFYVLMLSISKQRKISLLFSLIFAFATQTFSINSQALWQHGTANLFLIVSQIYFIKWLQNESSERKNGLLSIIFGVVAFASRTSFFIYLVAVSLLIFSRARRHKALFIASSICGALIVFSNNLYFWQSLFGGNTQPIYGLAITNVPTSLGGLLLSPARGTLFYTPFYIFSLVSVFFWARLKNSIWNRLFLLNFTYFILGVALYSLWYIWWAGNSWGDRLFTDIAVPSVILAYFFYIYIKSNLLKTFFFVFIAYSFLMQMIGVFAYPNSYWDSYPGNIVSNKARLWNFKDNPIIRSFALGPDWSAGPRLYNWLTHKDFYKIYIGDERKCSLDIIGEGKFLGYRIITVSFKNKSSIDWVTTGDGPTRDSLTLRQIFITKKIDPVTSPIIPTNLPRLIRSGQELIVRLVIVPPSDPYERLIVVPSQNEQSWDTSCKLNLVKN